MISARAIDDANSDSQNELLRINYFAAADASSTLCLRTTKMQIIDIFD